MNRRFDTQHEKDKFVTDYFECMNKKPLREGDHSVRLLSDFFNRQPSRDDITQFMNVARQAADKEESTYLNLRSLETAWLRVFYGKDKEECKDKHDKDRLRVAHHESGHAVIQAVQSGASSINWVSIQPCDSSAGRVCVERLKEKTEEQLLKEINMLLAGGLVEQYLEFVLDGKSFICSSDAIFDFLSRGWNQSDIHMIIKLTEELLGGLLEDQDILNYDDRVHEVISKQYVKAAHLVESHVPEIKAVAQELLKEKVISGKRVKEIIEQVQASKK